MKIDDCLGNGFVCFAARSLKECLTCCFPLHCFACFAGDVTLQTKINLAFLPYSTLALSTRALIYEFQYKCVFLLENRLGKIYHGSSSRENAS